jgi:3-hydroxymyristoyl/3-hydroxydecanoyl-(acyl carrier protein) dehydratase
MSTLIADTSFETFQLSFEQTVPRSLVHKRSIENVLLTEVRAVNDDRFICAGRIPAAHRFFNDAGRMPRKDILFYTELGRQASLAICHAFLGVARDEVFIFQQSQAVLDPSICQRGPRADAVVTEIRIQEIERRRNNAVSRVVAEHIMSLDGERVFHGTGAWTVQPAALFKRLRRIGKGGMPGTNPQPAEDNLDPAAARNNVISAVQAGDNPADFLTFLTIDQTHPYFFDHSCDHVPGMLLLEGCAQLARSVAGPTLATAAQQATVSAYDVDFYQFVECDAPVTLAAHVETADSRRAGTAAVDILISQHNVLSGTAKLTVIL